MKATEIKLFVAIVVTIALSGCTKEPSPDFNFDNNNAYVPVTVTFTNLSVNATSYSWDFGDGGVSTEKNPAHLYVTPGTIYVTLTAKNGSKTNSLIKTITLVTPPPTTFSIYNAISWFEINGMYSAYYDPTQGKYINIISHGNLQPLQSTPQFETTYSSRTIFFNVTSSTLVRIKYPYPIKKYIENILDIHDTTTLIPIQSINKDIAKINKSFSDDKQDEATTILEVQLSGSRYQ